MAADGGVVDVGVVLSILLVHVGAAFDERLDAVVGPVLDRQGQQRVAAAVELWGEQGEASGTLPAAIAAVEAAQHEVVVLHHGVVHRQEGPGLYHKDIS